MFVDEHPRFGRGHEVAIFTKGTVDGSRLMTVTSVQPRPIRCNRHGSTVAAWAALKPNADGANPLIHGEAAKSSQLCWRTIVQSLSRISRAFVNLIIVSGIGGQTIV